MERSISPLERPEIAKHGVMNEEGSNPGFKKQRPGFPLRREC
ncbi:hypothetical protein SynRCC2555_02879 [Synechococcus sp. WH 8101]|nr:hypothetical protein SynRCC2555_02879 [Synechococcus sp. WH 8101]